MDFYFHILNGLLFPYSKWTFISFRFISYSILCTLIFFIPFHSFLFLSIPFYNFLFYYFLFFSPFRSQSTIGFLPIFFYFTQKYLPLSALSSMKEFLGAGKLSEKLFEAVFSVSSELSESSSNLK